MYFFMQIIFLVSRSECLFVSLRSLDVKYFKCQYTCVRGQSHIKSSHSLNENGVKFQTHPPTDPVPFASKCQICKKIDVYNFRYEISVGILMKLFFLSHKRINKSVHKLVHKQIYSVKCSYYTHALSCAHFGKLQIVIRLEC